MSRHDPNGDHFSSRELLKGAAAIGLAVACQDACRERGAPFLAPSSSAKMPEFKQDGRTHLVDPAQYAAAKPFPIPPLRLDRFVLGATGDPCDGRKAMSGWLARVFAGAVGATGVAVGGRAETTMTVGWIWERLGMGTRGHLNQLLYRKRKQA